MSCCIESKPPTENAVITKSAPSSAPPAVGFGADVSAMPRRRAISLPELLHALHALGVEVVQHDVGVGQRRRVGEVGQQPRRPVVAPAADHGDTGTHLPPPGVARRRPAARGCCSHRGRGYAGVSKVETETARRGRGLAAVRDIELAEDVRDVHARGLGRDEQLVGDLAVGAALGDEREHVELARGETETVAADGGRRRGRRYRDGRGGSD